ncbi:hypothetical protein MFLAVUS_000745 [Mucor flavus]|uniref:Barwin domain-containing protein n=1 Tax=Mucor flavus TaxID=439312 RepID=A0ABP9YKJ0_9FUNG
MISIILVTYLFSLLIALSQAAGTTEDGKRAVARVMDFGDYQQPGGMSKRDRVTWYHGPDLRNAACYDRNGLAPFHARTDDMIGAMAMHNFEECYKCMQITNNRKKNLQIVVRIVDKCAACKVKTAIDLTPEAFKLLSPGGNLDVGVLDISYKAIKCPKNGLISRLPKL